MRQAIKDLRAQISSAKHPHAGLAYDSLVQGVGSDTQAKRDLVRLVTQIPAPEVFATFFKRWEQALQALPETRCEAGTIVGRTVIGLGAESVIETGFRFHHTYGVPFIPGSALKGLTAAFARQRLDKATWGIDSEAYRTLFGTTDASGCVDFHDALPRRYQLHADVLTVHHPAYYRSKGQEVPGDWESPVPVPFVSFSGELVFALSGPPAWRDAAMTILALALDHCGIGGKTSSGYGRLQLPNVDLSGFREVAEPQDKARLAAGQGAGAPGTAAVKEQRVPAAPASPAPSVLSSPKALQLEQRIAALKPVQQMSQQAEGLAQSIKSVPDEAERRELAQVLLRRFDTDASRFRGAVKDKPWYKQLLALKG